MAYEPVSGRGALYSWATLNEAPAPGFRDRLPLVVAIVELVEQPRLLLVSNLVDQGPEDFRIGLPLEVAFDDLPDCTLPVFRPASG